MSKSIYSKHTYGCPNCSQVQEHFTWSDLLYKTLHLCIKGGCGTMLGGEDIIVPKKKKTKAPGIRTPTKNRV